MPTEIEVTLKQATDLLAAGHTIKVILVVPDPQQEPKPTAKRKAAKFIPIEAMIGLSFEGIEPKKGKMTIAWLATKNKLWGKDAAAVYSRKQVDEMLQKEGADKTAFIYLLNKLKCMRVINEGEK